jgi:hypothetical protein
MKLWILFFSLTLIGSGVAVGYVALNSDGRDTGLPLSSCERSSGDSLRPAGTVTVELLPGALHDAIITSTKPQNPLPRSPPVPETQKTAVN